MCFYLPLSALIVFEKGKKAPCEHKNFVKLTLSAVFIGSYMTSLKVSVASQAHKI